MFGLCKKPRAMACIAQIDKNGNLNYVHVPSLRDIPKETINGVYTADGSPPKGTYKWNKKNLTYSLFLQQGQTFVDIPHTHNLFIAVNEALTTWEVNCGLKFSSVPFSLNADLRIAINNTDPMFIPPTGMTISPTMGYSDYPLTNPSATFTTVLNADYFWSLDGKFNFSYNINNPLRHESGHGIGCVHTVGVNDIMYPFYNNQIKQSPTDIDQVFQMYGPRVPPLNPIEYQAFYDSDAKLVEFT